MSLSHWYILHSPDWSLLHGLQKSQLLALCAEFLMGLLDSRGTHKNGIILCMKLSQMDDRIKGLETSDPVPSLHRMNITHESRLLMTWSQKLVRGHTDVASGSWLGRGSESAFQHLSVSRAEAPLLSA